MGKEAEPLARDFGVREHCSGSFPAARLSVGPEPGAVQLVATPYSR